MPVMTPENLTPGAWVGKRCFIVGGGPSLRAFDWTLLDGELTIGVNRSVEFFTPTIAYAMDRRFARWLKQGKFGDDANRRWAEHPCRVMMMAGSGGTEAMTAVGPNENERLFPGPQPGNNSGLGALHLALYLGASEIYLLGFDMGNHGGAEQANFHDGYPQTQTKSVYKKMFLPAFEKFAPEAKHRARIVNLNPDSALRCFEFGTFPEKYNRKTQRPEFRNVYIEGHYGFGDNLLFQRPFMRVLQQRFNVFLRTTFPEAYHDLEGVFPVRATTHLRTQTKHERRSNPALWYDLPARATKYNWPAYWKCFGLNVDAWSYNAARMGIDPGCLDASFPLRPEWIADARIIANQWGAGQKTLCLVKRPTVRKEWIAESRNPLDVHFQRIVDRYRDRFFFVSIADTQPGEEWFTGEIEGMDRKYDHGELPFTTLLGLTQFTHALLSGPGFFLPLGLSTRVPMFIIFGGAQKPEWLVHPAMDLSRCAFSAPEPFCACSRPRHNCNKEIPPEVLLREFDDFSRKQGLIAA